MNKEGLAEKFQDIEWGDELSAEAKKGEIKLRRRKERN